MKLMHSVANLRTLPSCNGYQRSRQSVWPFQLEGIATTPHSMKKALDLCVLITGGAGGVGHHAVVRFLHAGYRVRSCDIREPAVAFPEEVDFRLGDICDSSTMLEMCKGVDIVVHTAAMICHFGRYDLVRSVNVVGTKVLLECARRAGVRRFIHTSSVSVLYRGLEVSNNVSEDAFAEFYPVEKQVDDYILTKQEGEKLVIDAHVDGKFSTIAFRPGGIYGDGLLATDLMLEMLIQRRFPTYAPDTKINWTSVDNLIDAYLLAADKRKWPVHGPMVLHDGSDGEKHNAIVDAMTQHCRISGPMIPICPPIILLYFIGWCNEIGYNVLSTLVRVPIPSLVRGRVLQIGTDRTYSCERAEKLLGYAPKERDTIAGHIAVLKGMEPKIHAMKEAYKVADALEYPSFAWMLFVMTGLPLCYLLSDTHWLINYIWIGAAAIHIMYLPLASMLASFGKLYQTRILWSILCMLFGFPCVALLYKRALRRRKSLQRGQL